MSSDYDERVRGLRTTIARILDIQTEEIEQALPDVSSVFFGHVKLLATKWKDWHIVLDLLKQARQIRQTTCPPEVSHTAEWSVYDSDKAQGLEPKPQVSKPASRSITAPNNPGDTPKVVGDHPVRTHVIACCMSRSKDLALDSIFVKIPFQVSTVSLLGGYLGQFDGGYLEQLEQTLGRQLISQEHSGEIDDEDEEENSMVHIHQHVLTMKAAEGTGNMTVELRNMERLEDMLSRGGLHAHLRAIIGDNTDNIDNIVIFAPWDSTQINDLLQDALYQGVQEAGALVRNLRAYPARDEANAQGHKLGDIAALDQIAREPSTPSAFAYRPETCYGQGPCPLEDCEGKMVFKRTCSSGALDVEIGEASDKSLWRRLKCQNNRNTRVRTRRDDTLPGRTWLHQEYIDSLTTFGEIRVFMRGDDIINVAISRWKATGKTREMLMLRSFRPQDDLSWFSSDKALQQQKLVELNGLCYFFRTNLLEYSQTRRDFDSGGRFFINEVARWYGAGFFSWQILASPYDDICRQMGDKFAEECATQEGGE
ncbi:hypothetical protein FZEAL_10281 [Fusarium zealandicum]|uniref:Uncharacterized protein n=1 Tax=Fusarium zealandicum TaxID=1053134 RepID=A0A8H4XCB6_9HYPO|nr:hypothetical protein FZEAL_10281 [Fusarium zealandicum]